MSFEICMDIFDWYDAPLYEHITHILLSKLDGEERIRRAFPALQEHATQLLDQHRDDEDAFEWPA